VVEPHPVVEPVETTVVEPHPVVEPVETRNRRTAYPVGPTMRTALIRTYGDPDVVETADVDDPLLGPDSILVEMAAASVNPVDWKLVAGYL
jgi:hypothetical protein